MSVDRAIVFANGNCSSADIRLAAVAGADLLVCVDGGFRHCIAAGLTPGLLIGDMDSIAEADRQLADARLIEHVVFPSDKDASDLELALRHLANLKMGEVVVLGASGGRTDHMLFNWSLVARQPWPFALRLVDSSVDMHLVRSPGDLQMPLAQGTLISIMPADQAATGVQVGGVRYPLDNARLEPGSTLGLSNVSTGEPLTVGVQRGSLLVFVCRNELGEY